MDNNENKNTSALPEYVTLGEYADLKKMDLYHRGRLIGNFVEDAVRLMGDAAPKPVGSRGMQRLYRAAELETAYPLVKAAYKKTSLPAPHEVEIEGETYANIPALVEVVGIDNASINYILNSSPGMVRRCSLNNARATYRWHKAEAVTLLNAHKHEVYTHDHTKDSLYTDEAAQPDTASVEAPYGDKPLDKELIVAALESMHSSTEADIVEYGDNPAIRFALEANRRRLDNSLAALRTDGAVVLRCNR